MWRQGRGKRDGLTSTLSVQQKKLEKARARHLHSLREKEIFCEELA